MIQVKTLRRKSGTWKDENLPDYEKRVNEFCKSVKVVKINTTTSIGTIHHTVVYETE